MSRVLFFFVACTLLSTLHISAQRTLPRNEPKGAMIQFFQRGEQLQCNEEDRFIRMSRESFEIRFNLRRYTQQDPSAMRVMFTVTPPDATVLESDGAGIAGMMDSLYQDAIIDPGAFHYIYYSDQNARRANLLVEKGNHLYLSWPIETLEYEYKPMAVQAFQPETLYVSFYSDWNQNQVMDAEEHFVYRIQFTD